MTRSTKVNLIDAYDALTAVATARRPPIIMPGQVVRSCDVCDHSTASRARHPVACPIGAALRALDTIVPAKADRKAWISTP
ncbi:MAG TPA: hypothetical protein VER98_18600 [Terriglobia bacterium]|nr:hypothetical protein [Terriglobia bacterium]